MRHLDIPLARGGSILNNILSRGAIGNMPTPVFPTHQRSFNDLFLQACGPTRAERTVLVDAVLKNLMLHYREEKLLQNMEPIRPIRVAAVADFGRRSWTGGRLLRRQRA